MTTATHQHTLTNTCTCVTYDDDLGDFREAPECWGDCWNDAVEDFTWATMTFRKSNTTDWWKVSNLRLWNGEVSGFFHNDPFDVHGLIHSMAVNGAWIMRYKVYDDRIEYSLSHHDAPTGSASVLTIPTLEELQQLGVD